MSDVVIYTRPFCGFCASAISLLNKKGVAFTEIEAGFDPAKRQFVEYGPFIDLAYMGVDCRTKVVKTYENNGAAGCIYEAGWYRWINGELLPVRVESQDGGVNGSFLRTITVWPDGNAIVLSTQAVPLDDCHVPNKPADKHKE